METTILMGGTISVGPQLRNCLHGDNHLDGWDHICRSSVKELSPISSPNDLLTNFWVLVNFGCTLWMVEIVEQFSCCLHPSCIVGHFSPESGGMAGINTMCHGSQSSGLE